MLSSFIDQEQRIPRAPRLALGLVEVFWDIISVAFSCNDVSRPIEGLQSDCFSIPSSRSQLWTARVEGTLHVVKHVRERGAFSHRALVLSFVVEFVEATARFSKSLAKHHYMFNAFRKLRR